jgi:aldehyde:ferredoxin oxidoreductase
MRDVFVGGRGFDLWLLWNSLPHDRIIKWNDPENELCIACGPLGGTPVFPGSGKSIVVSLSPLTGSVLDSNVGGYFGSYLKFAGWDALEIQGKAHSEILVFIDGDKNKVQIEDASELPTETEFIVEILADRFAAENPQSISVVSSGPGAEHTYFGCLNFSWYDAGRKIHRFKQAGRGGLGTVLRDKKIKAIIVKYSGQITVESNNPADVDMVKAIGRAYNQEIRKLDPNQNEMARIGTTHLVTIMNDFDLLPVRNFRFGSHPEASELGSEIYRRKFHEGFDGCWLGCSLSCAHGVKDFELKTGPYKGRRVFVNGPEYETIAGIGSNCGIFDADHVIEANYYCDLYGLDTISVGTSIAFAMECYENGVIDRSATDGLDLRFGEKEAVLELLHQMARGEGFGTVIGRGVKEMKKILVEKHGADVEFLEDIGMEAKGLEFSEYVTKESLAQQGGYGLALKGPQHDEAWLIFLDMVHNLMPTFEQKAEREPAKVISHVENYAKFFYAVTGRKITADEIILMSERVYNFQRIFNLRMGFGKRAHDAIPYRAVGPVTMEEYESREKRYDGQLEKIGCNPQSNSTEEKIAILRKHREAEYEKLMDAVYKRRGWNREGIPTLQKAKQLGIDFPRIIEVIQGNLQSSANSGA